MPRRGRATGRLLTGVAACLLATPLAACSGGSEEPATAGSASATSAGAPATTAYPSGAATDTVLTEPGTRLSLGQQASVAWTPRQGLVGTLRIRVDDVERTTFERSFRDWKVDPATATHAPYLVHALVTNIGATDLGGQQVPLYAGSAAGALVEPATFRTTFKPCHPSVLPRPFGPGASTSACLVYLVPDGGEVAGVTFRPEEGFTPVTWTGPVRTLGAQPRRRSAG